MTRTRRTPAEIIAAKTAEIEKLHIRAAQQEAKSSPIFSPLRELDKSFDKIEANARKTLGSGPQGAEVRIESHTKWIAEITHLVELSTQQLASIKAARKMIREAIAGWVSGDEPKKKDVTAGVRLIQKAFDEATVAASKNYETAQTVRKSVKAESKTEAAEAAESESE